LPDLPDCPTGSIILPGPDALRKFADGARRGCRVPVRAGGVMLSSGRGSGEVAATGQMRIPVRWPAVSACPITRKRALP